MKRNVMNCNEGREERKEGGTSGSSVEWWHETCYCEEGRSRPIGKEAKDGRKGRKEGRKTNEGRKEGRTLAKNRRRSNQGRKMKEGR